MLACQMLFATDECQAAVRQGGQSGSVPTDFRWARRFAPLPTLRQLVEIYATRLWLSTANSGSASQITRLRPLRLAA